MSDKVTSFAKGQAIHRPQGWIRSYRSKVEKLAAGKISIEAYALFDVLLHIVCWDPKKPAYGQIERNITKIQAHWFPKWSRSTLLKYLKELEADNSIIQKDGMITVTNFAKYQSKKGVEQSTLTVEQSTLTVEQSTLTVEQSTLTVEQSTLKGHQTRTIRLSPGAKETLKKLKNNISAPPSGDGEKASQKTAPKKSEKPPKEKPANGWSIWVDANRAAGRKDPAPLGKNTAIAKRIFDGIGRDPVEMRAIFDAFLADEDPWIVKGGYSLGALETKLESYRNRPKAEEWTPTAEQLHEAITVWAIGGSFRPGETRSQEELFELGMEMYKRGELANDDIFDMRSAS